MLTKEQRRERRKQLGASDIGTIFGLNPYQTPLQLWAEKTGRTPIDDDDGDEGTRIGHLIEPVLLGWAESELGPLRRDVLYRHERAPIVSRLDAEALEGKEVVEAKTAGLMNRWMDLDAWGDAESEDIPLHYAAQIQTQMACSGGVVGYCYALIGGRGRVRFRIDRKPQAIEMIETVARQWWTEHVLGDKRPPEDARDVETLRDLTRDTKSEIILPERARRIIEIRENIKLREKVLKHRERTLTAELLTTLDDGIRGRCDDGTTIEIQTISRRGYTVDPTEYKQLRVKKPKAAKPKSKAKGKAKAGAE